MEFESKRGSTKVTFDLNQDQSKQMQLFSTAEKSSYANQDSQDFSDKNRSETIPNESENNLLQTATNTIR